MNAANGKNIKYNTFEAVLFALNVMSRPAFIPLTKKARCNTKRRNDRR